MYQGTSLPLLSQNISWTFFIASIVPALLIATPLFYSTSDLAEGIRPFLYLNPLTFYVEATRDILVGGTFPHWLHLLGSLAVGAATFHVGYGIAMAVRDQAVDAL